MTKNNRPPEKKPLVVLQSHFEPFVILLRHPFRLALMILVPGFLLPEIQWLVHFVSGLEGFLNLMVCGAVLMVFILMPPLVVNWLDYRKIRYELYDGFLQFQENFFLPEKLRIRSRAIKKVTVNQNWVQKKCGVGDILLEAENIAGRIRLKNQGHIIPDIRHPHKAAKKIEQIVQLQNAAPEKTTETEQPVSEKTD